MRNRLTVQTHIGEGMIDSKKIVTTPRAGLACSGILTPILDEGEGCELRRGGGVFCCKQCKVQTAAFHTEISFRISLCALALQLGRPPQPVRNLQNDSEQSETQRE